MTLPISTDILFTSVVTETSVYKDNGTDIAIEPFDPPRLALNLCLVSARWAKATLWVETTGPDATLSHFEFPAEQMLENIQTSPGTSDFMQMQHGWLTGIGSESNTISNRTVYRDILDFCTENEGMKPICFMITLGLHHITNAIASSVDILMFRDEEAEMSDDPHSYLVLRITSYVYTYAYEFQNSSVIPMALTFLLFHPLMALMHLATIILSKHTWYTSSWGSFGQMLVLALRSRDPGGLGNGEEIKGSETWTKNAIVGAMGDEGRLEIVLKEAEGARE